MPQLIAPDVRVRRSFLEAMAEFRVEGRGSRADDTMVGAEMRKFTASWSTQDGFASFVAALHAQSRGKQLPAGFVACTTLWWVHGDAYLGRIAIRHELTPACSILAGTSAMTSARRLGVMAMRPRCCKAAMPVARDLGIENVLITCDVANIASRKVIEACGGQLEDERGGKLRFWART